MGLLPIDDFDMIPHDDELDISLAKRDAQKIADRFRDGRLAFAGHDTQGGSPAELREEK